MTYIYSEVFKMITPTEPKDMKRLLIYTIGIFCIQVCIGQQLLDDETSIGLTYYDLQTERTMQNRVHVFDDGTIGAVWNQGELFPGFEDLGVGYNYFDGDSWGPYPTGSFTNWWARNPSYTAYGEIGELCVSELVNGFSINWRTVKGTGSWQEDIFYANNGKHPVAVTSGVDNTIVHLLYLIADPMFEPTAAQTYRGHLRYARSSDGMQTWDIDMEVPGLGEEDYLGFTTDSYCWAEPRDDVLAFVIGDYLTDLILMKSEDGGDTWEKTIIWEHPYPMFEIFSFESDTFYCNGGSMSVAMEESGFAHVAFSLSRVFSTIEQDTLWHDPYVGGIAYWREDMPAFKNTLNSLNPDSLGVCDNLIAWMQDMNGNGSIDLVNPPFYPSLGLLSMPNLAISNYGNIFLVFSSVTETYDNAQYNYNHLWFRAGHIESCYWGEFEDLTDDLIHIFDECVFPSMAQFVDDNLYLTYQYDTQPGSSLIDNNFYGENKISFLKIDLNEWKSDQKEGLFVDFKINQDTIYEGDTVWFQNLSCGCPFPFSYTWGFEGGSPASSNDPYPTVVYEDAGIYDVNLHADNGQSTSVTVKPDYITVYPINSEYEMREPASISVYPNPARDRLTIQLDKPVFAVVRLYDKMGHTVMEREYTNAATILIHTMDLPAGIYFLEVNTGNTVLNNKIVLGK